MVVLFNVEIDAELVGQFNLRYVVSNDAGQGVGTVRLTTVPKVQTVGLQTGSASQISEDTTFMLGGRVDLTGNLSSGVTPAPAFHQTPESAPNSARSALFAARS